MKYVSGNANKQGRLFLDGNEFCAEDWEITESADEEETTNTCSAGQEEFMTTTRRLEGTINYTWEASNNPMDNPPNLGAGTEHPSTRLYLHASPGVGNQDGPFYELNMKILSHRVAVPVKGKVAGTITFKSTGPYILPTGEDSSSGL
jgi:hypothetical protein